MFTCGFVLHSGRSKGALGMQPTPPPVLFLAFACSFWQKIFPNSGFLPQNQGLESPSPPHPLIQEILEIHDAMLGSDPI